MGTGQDKAGERYRARGVSPQKEDVHRAVVNQDPGLYPSAFCKLIPDHLGGDPAWCLAMHADGAGTKSVMAYLHYKETGDASVFRGIAQDALVMNIDDLLCVGATGPFLVSNTIGRNARLIPGEVISELIGGFDQLSEELTALGVTTHMTGGETADVGDAVRTLLVDATVTVRLPREKVIPNAHVKPGDVIIGLGSAGKTTYEARYNSGMGSNGLTSARHDLLNKIYRDRYPESVEPGMPEELQYSGPFRLEDPLDGTELTISEALLSPTRTYAPLLMPLLAHHRKAITALIHCTGGGQTKCLRAGKGVHYIKDNLFTPPPLFQTIASVTGTPFRELYQVLNMGHRMEVVGDPSLLTELEGLGKEYGVEVQVVGRVEEAKHAHINQLTLHTPDGLEEFSLDRRRV